MAGNPTFQIPRDVIEPIVSAQIQAGIVTALGGRDELIRECTRYILEMKVDSGGRPVTDRYELDRCKTTFLTWIMQNSLRDAIKAAVSEYVENHTAALKSTLIDELKKQKSPLAKQLVNGMVGAIAHPDLMKWRMKIEFDPPRD